MMVHRSTMKMLSDLISPKALERILSDAARERHVTLSTLDVPTLQDILKRDIYKRLQLSIPAALAKRRVQEVLESLEQEAVRQTAESHTTQIITLEDQAKQFALYFDWPETQRLRAVLSVARQTTAEGRDAETLLLEGAELIETLERKLREGLVTQGQDLSELKASLGRLAGVGGPKIKRLEALVKQISEAQESRTLLPAEVERALALTLTLRKQVESSVVQQLKPEQKAEMVDGMLVTGHDEVQPFDISLLSPEAQARVQTLEREHEARQLTELAREHAALLRHDPDLDAELTGLRDRSNAAQVLGEPAITALRERLAQARADRMTQQQTQLTELSARLEHLGVQGHDESVQLARQLLSVVQGTQQAGGLALDELAQLGDLVTTLESSDARSREQLMALQRETFELERRAREVPGALTDLQPLIEQARATLAAGQNADLEPLWSILERRMGEAAQQREQMDARAARVMQDYDRYRHLAGETIQKLGRLADVLREQQRLGTLSSDARTRYLQTLESAEALLTEAQAEFQAAREVTATFGADALSDLLGVFDSDAFEQNDVATDLLSTESSAPIHTDPAPPAPARASQDPFGLAALLAATSAQPAPEEATLFESALPFPSGTPDLANLTLPPAGTPDLPHGVLVRTWRVTKGQVAEGDLSPAGDWSTETDCEADVLRLAWLADQAAELHPSRLTLDVGGRCWLTMPQLGGSTLVVYAPDLVMAERAAAQWAERGTGLIQN